MQPIACTPASGWEKGQVENQVGLVRERFFTPRLRVKSLDELNAWLLDKCVAYAKTHRHPEESGKTVWERFEAEPPHLVPYAGPFDGFHSVPASVSKTCTVRFNNNKYSVLATAVGRPVEVHAYADRITIRQDGVVVGEHARVFGRGQTVYDPWHYVPVLARIARASSIGTDWVVVSSDEGTRLPRAPLVLPDAQMLKELPNVSGVMPGRWEQAQIRAGGLSTETDVIGTDQDFQTVHGWRAARGSFFTEQEERSGAPVLLLGHTIAERLFPDGADPTGEFVMVNNAPFLVSGVLERKGLNQNGNDRDDLVAMPLRSLESRVYGAGKLSVIVVALRDMGLLADSVADITRAMTQQHGREDFWLTDAATAFQEAAQARQAQNMLLGVISAISIFVGGIGVMNIMFITVRERRREIGIRAATGARTRDIFVQFMTEALVLSGIGGLVGLALAGGIGAVAAWGFGMTVIFSASVAVVALFGALTMGAVFGCIPALRAARLDPVVALTSH